MRFVYRSEPLKPPERGADWRTTEQFKGRRGRTSVVKSSAGETVAVHAKQRVPPQSTSLLLSRTTDNLGSTGESRRFDRLIRRVPTYAA
jgi:hypothetical protein